MFLSSDESRMLILKRVSPFFYSPWLTICFIALVSMNSYGDTLLNDNPVMSWLSMMVGLLGGLALFLYGIGKMSDALQAVAGSRLKRWLANVTKNRILGAFSGAAVTSIIQSSSVTTVLVVGFVSAGLLSMTQSIGVIMGANIGTTVTAQIVAFKVTNAALLFVFVGFCCWFFGRQERVKAYGNVVMGLGLIFLGMNIMSDAMTPLRSYEPFLEFMRSMSSPFMAILTAAGFTALVQSSSATTAIVIVMASQGFVGLEAGIALALGANVGTCVTAMLASIGKNVEARRAALVHVLFNVLGALIWLPLISQLAELSMWISPVSDNLTDLDRLAADTPRQIANANTLFNVANTILFLPFAHYLGVLAQRLLPDRSKKDTAIIHSKYLDFELVETPALALARVRLEVARMGQIVMTMLTQFSNAMGTRDLLKINKVSQKDDQVDLLQEELLRYLASIRKTTLTSSQTREFSQLMAAIDHIEHVGDSISVGLVRVAHKFIEFDVYVSEETRHDFEQLFEKLELAFALATRAVSSEDQQSAQHVISMSDEIELAISVILDRQAEKLKEDAHRPIVFRVEMAFCEQARNVYSLSRRMAILVLPRKIAPDA